MDNYVPRISHAILTIALATVLIILGEKSGSPYVKGFWFGAIALMIITAVILYLIILRERDNYNRTITETIIALSKLDSEGREMLAWFHPTMSYVMKHGKVTATFENTGVPIELFHLFMQDSNDKYIAPVRDWCTKERPEWAWRKIYDFMVKGNWVEKDSYAGSHPNCWRGNAYSHFCAYWMAGRGIPNPSEV